jgi:hypothetical protein
MAPNSHDPLIPSANSPIDNFVAVATEYCSLVERHRQYSVGDFLARIRVVLPVLYYRALQLPEIESADEKAGREITHDEWQELFGSLQTYFGDHDLYWVVFDPIKVEPNDPVASSLADDLADIWRDLTNGLTDWNGASQSPEVVWKLHFDFHWHWSSHLVDALRTIDSLAEYYEVDTKDEGT